MMFSVLFNLIGIALIIFVVWWFWLGKTSKLEKAINANQKPIEIKVADGIYTPDAIKARIGQTLTLRFIREDETPCAATVLFPDFDQSLELPLDKAVDIKLTPDKKGQFEFTCQMGMYRGELIVVA